MTGRAGDAILLNDLTTHNGSVNAAESQHPRVSQFARHSHRITVVFPDTDGTPWSSPPHNGTTVESNEQSATGFLPPGHPGRKLSRNDVR